ncbi:MAG: IclR family transcriptional regulator [Rhodospirillaceae bacterium]
MPATALDPAPKPARIRQVPAVTRAVAILRLLGDSDAPLGVNPIARELGLVPSTCLHILRILVDEGLVEVDPETKRYALGVGLLPIARNVMRRNAFNQVAQPHLDALAADFGVTAIGVQMTDADHMVVVAISRAPVAFGLRVDIGSRFPSLISATGRCFAAFGGVPAAELESRFRKLKWDNPPDFDAWRAEVETTRARGWGLDEGAYISGVSVLSVPVTDAAASTPHYIVAVGVSEQLKKAGVAALATRMLDAAGAAGRAMGGENA